jgi:hypothetical protein
MSFQARRDAKPPSAIRAAQYVGTMVSARIDAVLTLEAADRNHDRRIGDVGSISFDRSVGLGAFGRCGKGFEAGQRCGDESR